MSATAAVAVVSCSSCRPARASRQKSGQPPQAAPPPPALPPQQQALPLPLPSQQQSQTISRLSPDMAAAMVAAEATAVTSSGTSASKALRKSAAPGFGRRFTIDCSSSLNYNEVLDWQKSFDRLMASPIGRRLFGEFLKLEHSYCNLEFWLCCERLRSTNDKEEYAQQARAIYDRYISPHSSQEVNLDGCVKQCVQQACSANPETADFAEAARQVYALMSFDSYPRFIRSAPVKALVESRFAENEVAPTDIDSGDDRGNSGNEKAQ